MSWAGIQYGEQTRCINIRLLFIPLAAGFSDYFMFDSSEPRGMRNQAQLSISALKSSSLIHAFVRDPCESLTPQVPGFGLSSRATKHPGYAGLPCSRTRTRVEKQSRWSHHHRSSYTSLGVEGWGCGRPSSVKLCAARPHDRSPTTPVQASTRTRIRNDVA